MFLHLCVILFTGGRGVGFPACITGHMTRGMGVCIWGTVCLYPGGWADPPMRYMGYGQQAGSTHPTEMHSCYRPQRSWGKVIFSQVSVILLTGVGCYPACIAGGIPACLAAGLRGGGVGAIPACIAGVSQHALQQGSGGGSALRGLFWGGPSVVVCYALLLWPSGPLPKTIPEGHHTRRP